mmetsp:Transcript_131914/g.228603  ORF Transcript_131914/g.228603 Transcript_131914/m.228603 type:complete len:143 (-) Transcript_131914:549-977(-)
MCLMGHTPAYLTDSSQPATVVSCPYVLQVNVVGQAQHFLPGGWGKRNFMARSSLPHRPSFTGADLFLELWSVAVLPCGDGEEVAGDHLLACTMEPHRRASGMMGFWRWGWRWGRWCEASGRWAQLSTGPQLLRPPPGWQAGP